jgi:hypothetical protein
MGNVDDIAEDVAPMSFGKDLFVEWGGVRGGEHEEHAVEVAGLERALVPFEFCGSVPFANFFGGFRGHDAQVGAGVQEAFDFAFGDRACANDHARSALKFEEEREEVHGELSHWMWNWCKVWRLKRRGLPQRHGGHRDLSEVSSTTGAIHGSEITARRDTRIGTRNIRVLRGSRELHRQVCGAGDEILWQSS